VRRIILVGLSAVVIAGGCPLDPSARFQSGVTARISVSSTTGEAPLHVVVSAAESTSERGTITGYAWDFAGQYQANGLTAEYTFTQPGRYPVTLTVTDSRGEQNSSRVFVRVSGGDVTAVITADPLSGPEPLLVHFDGTQSSATGDTILDYTWDFGDGAQSRESAPMHVYEHAGEYTVTLRVVSGGGLEASAQATITVGEGVSASLQFNGSQFATLPVTTADPLTALTIEAWINPEDAGGTVASFGVPNIALSVSPSAGLISVRHGSDAVDLGASVRVGQWQHIALSYTDGESATVYLDGLPVGVVALEGTVFATNVTLGAGYRGKIARVRFWSTGRSAADIAAGAAGQLTGFEEGLLGDWPLADGSGQTLGNHAAGGTAGTLGASEAPEATDPAWSSDAP